MVPRHAGSLSRDKRLGHYDNSGGYTSRSYDEVVLCISAQKLVHGVKLFRPRHLWACLAGRLTHVSWDIRPKVVGSDEGDEIEGNEDRDSDMHQIKITAFFAGPDLDPDSACAGGSLLVAPIIVEVDGSIVDSLVFPPAYGWACS